MDDLTLVGGADEGLGFEVLASSLRADAGDLHAFVEALATKLEGALPAQTRVERARDGLLKSTTHVTRITVELAGARYLLATGRHGALETACAKIVGGVVIKTEQLPVDAWIDALARGLAAHARSNATARAALQRLIT